MWGPPQILEAALSRGDARTTCVNSRGAPDNDGTTTAAAAAAGRCVVRARATHVRDVAVVPYRIVAARSYRVVSCRVVSCRALGDGASSSRSAASQLVRRLPEATPYALTSSRRRQRWWMFFIYERAREITREGRGCFSIPLSRSPSRSFTPYEKAGNRRDYAAVHDGNVSTATLARRRRRRSRRRQRDARRPAGGRCRRGEASTLETTRTSAQQNGGKLERRNGTTDGPTTMVPTGYGSTGPPALPRSRDNLIAGTSR